MLIQIKIIFSFMNHIINTRRGNLWECLFPDQYSRNFYRIWKVPYFPVHKTHFFSPKCDLNSTCILCAEGTYYFQTYKSIHLSYEESDASSENNHEDDFSGSDDDFVGFYDE